LEARVEVLKLIYQRDRFCESILERPSLVQFGVTVH